MSGRCFNAKEDEASEIIHALLTAKDLGFVKIHAVLDALEVINGTNGADDWSIGNFVEISWDFLNHFFS